MRGKNPNAPMQTFKYSIIYLMALFVIMLLDHYLFPVSDLMSQRSNIRLTVLILSA